MRFAKGHGTGNDFVLVPDPDGVVRLAPVAVRALCDRRRGIGGDGLLRVVRTAKVAEAVHLAAEAEWFMDYHNADGTTAEMCGNGIRVYARWLLREQLWNGARTLGVATRDGVKSVRLTAGGTVCVDMGAPRVVSGSRTVRVADRMYAGTEVWMGNPHVVVRVEDLEDAGPLVDAPDVAPHLETNVEFVVASTDTAFAMRVHERGAGETQSCGTGACAAAVAMASWAGHSSGQWEVEVRGGRLEVDWDGTTVRLSGPADVVAEGTLDPVFLEQVGLEG